MELLTLSENAFSIPVYPYYIVSIYNKKPFATESSVSTFFENGEDITSLFTEQQPSPITCKSHKRRSKKACHLTETSSDNLGKASSDNLGKASSDNLGKASSDNLTETSSDNLEETSSDDLEETLSDAIHSIALPTLSSEINKTRIVKLKSNKGMRPSGKEKRQTNQCFWFAVRDGMQEISLPNVPSTVQALREIIIGKINKSNNYQKQHDSKYSEFKITGEKTNKKTDDTIFGKNETKINSSTTEFDCLYHGSAGIAVALHFSLTIRIYGLINKNECNQNSIFEFGNGKNIINIAYRPGHFEYISSFDDDLQQDSGFQEKLEKHYPKLEDVNHLHPSKKAKAVSSSPYLFHVTTRGNSGKSGSLKNSCFLISVLDGMHGISNAPKSTQELREQAIRLINDPENDYQEQHEKQIQGFIVKGKSNSKSSKNKKSSECSQGTITGKNGTKINSPTSEFDCLEHGSTGIAVADHYGLTICIYGLFDGNQCNEPIYTFGSGRRIVNVALFTNQGHFEYITKLEPN